MPQVLVVALCFAVALQPVPVAPLTVTVTPADELYCRLAVVVAYVTLSAKYDSSAVTRLRRSDFIDAMYAFSFVFANFGSAMAARRPIMTTASRSAISVKPFVLRIRSPSGSGFACAARWCDESRS